MEDTRHQYIFVIGMSLGGKGLIKRSLEKTGYCRIYGETYLFDFFNAMQQSCDGYLRVFIEPEQGDRYRCACPASLLTEIRRDEGVNYRENFRTFYSTIFSRHEEMFVGEALVYYKGMIGNYRRMFPHAKFVFVERDPKIMKEEYSPHTPRFILRLKTTVEEYIQKTLQEMGEEDGYHLNLSQFKDNVEVELKRLLSWMGVQEWDNIDFQDIDKMCNSVPETVEGIRAMNRKQQMSIVRSGYKWKGVRTDGVSFAKRRTGVVSLIGCKTTSRRVKEKNFQEINGRSLIDRAITRAVESGEVGEIYLMGDNMKVVEPYLERDCFSRASCFFIQEPAYMLRPSIGTCQMVFYFLSRYEQKTSKVPEYIAISQPSHPFVSPDTIKKCIQKIKEVKCDTVTAVLHDDKAKWCGNLLEDGRWQSDISLKRRKNSDDYVNLSKHTGACVVFSVDSFLKNSSIFGEDVYGVPIKGHEAFDINTEEEFEEGKRLGKLLDL